MEGKGAGLVLPRCNTEAMTLHLAEISRAVRPGAHAVVLLDQAGWHGSKRLEVPDNITLFPLPPRSLELNPVENVWAVHPRQLAVQPGLQVLRRYPRPLLRRLEQSHRPALENHVDRNPSMGTWVIVNGIGYDASRHYLLYTCLNLADGPAVS